ncbi:hypothetical protein RND81_06G004500 [Saponaria officinalis]|uniref:MULE transposase domain-containing protein n=1 Tax=Saponaria officinalis TaxID=3572 RepID=A0AAW1K555_SAPOF
MTLCRVFWADAEAIRNYSCFGDAISFDPTYGTNKYCMVFTPFTGVDHHKRSVFFGASLLSNEDGESFKWTFENFLKAMSQKEPQCIITDQDPAIKNAVRSVFKKSRHCFCMWHIMGKVTDKVGSSICRDTDFLSRLCSIVWDSDLEPFEFEEKWTELMNDFEMVDHSWFSAMFSIRKKWIPAYHRDFPMGCILRKTQRSESANSFFKRYENHFGTLVEFWMRFQTAVDQQRYFQKCADNDNAHSLPVTVTHLHLEAHAASVYTHSVFYEFQVEVKAAIMSCGVGGFTREQDVEITDVDDAGTGKTFNSLMQYITY